MNIGDFDKNKFATFSRILKTPDDFSEIKNKVFGDTYIDLPEKLKDWLLELKYLDGVPMNYIIPNDNMLPPESIRFFLVDRAWLIALIDGAVSIGRATNYDLKMDEEFQEGIFSSLELNENKMTGFLLRSSVVKGWPNMVVDALDINQNKLNAKRLNKVAPDVMLGIYEGEINQINFHEAFQVIHFGYDKSSENEPKKKELKFINNDKNGVPGKVIDQIELDLEKYIDKDTRILNVSETVEEMKTLLSDYYTGSFTAAEFALEMIQGVEEVGFIFNNQKEES